MAAEPFVGQIQAFGFSFSPVNWLPCDGRALSINQYQILYTLIGTVYGGDGNTNFNIPDLQGRVAIGQGQGTGLTARTMGQKGGALGITINSSQMPAHSHSLTGTTGGGFKVSSKAGTVPTPDASNNTIGAANDLNGNNNNAYNNLPPTVPINTGATGGPTVSVTGSSQPFDNRQPYQVINYCVAVLGIFPSRN